LKLAGDEEMRLAKRYTNNSEAYDLYLKASNTRNRSEALDLLQRAVAKDPNLALAYVRIAGAYVSSGIARRRPSAEVFPKVRDAARKAIELDDTLGNAHLTLAEVLMDWDWDWQGAERELKRGIELNLGVGHVLYSRYLMDVGRLQDALAEAERAEEIDPLSPAVHAWLALVYYEARQYDRAIQEARGSWGKVFGAFALAEKGQYSESIAILKANTAGAGDRGHIGDAYAKAGNRAEAERICDELQQRSKKEGVGAYEVAFINAALGRKDEAFRWLDIAYQQRDPGLAFLKVDPCLDPLRSDPRFDQLVRRVGLPV
jgi:tetratricopeptide (TPR) repeat protein